MRIYRTGDAAPPVLFLHGAKLDTARGCGAASPRRAVLDDDFFRRFLQKLLDVLALPRAVLVALSLGFWPQFRREVAVMAQAVSVSGGVGVGQYRLRMRVGARPREARNTVGQ